MSEKKNYERGMKITFDQKARSVMVSFRGRVTVLPGPFATEGEAVRAGEGLCKTNGWDDSGGGNGGKSLLTRHRPW
tara:strand:- start:427 stop:654 length:228 start_codon:yes stop_codon:yes gene_type:complete